MNYTVLVCDDDDDITAALEVYLAQDNYNVVKASNGAEAVEAVKNNDIHLILLDVMMPVMDGINAAVKIRAASDAPIIFLSAKSEDTDRIFGLNMGGDDYVTKPFNPVELLARVKANLRRYSRMGGIKEESKKGVYVTGGLVLDDNKKQVTVEGEAAELTPIEYNILKFLMENMDFVFSSDQIYERVWNEPAFDIGKIVSVHIRHIREKIEINPKEPRYLKVVYGLGYKVVSGQ
ncbi:MAG: response regulator transcription factor [Oscillospiraceae bacterium]|nr:response regulator transcription factor [Oscillospiraceae bacterium]